MSIKGVIKAPTAGVGEMYRHRYVGRYPPLNRALPRSGSGTSTWNRKQFSESVAQRPRRLLPEPLLAMTSLNPHLHDFPEPSSAKEVKGIRYKSSKTCSVPVRANLRIHLHVPRQWFCCKGIMDIEWTKSRVTIPTGVRCARTIGRTTKTFLHKMA